MVSRHSDMVVMRRLRSRFCFESQASSYPQVQICLKMAASMPQQRFFDRWSRLNTSLGPWKREIVRESAGFEATGSKGSPSSLQPSFERLPRGSSGEKTTATIASWVDIQFLEQACC